MYPLQGIVQQIPLRALVVHEPVRSVHPSPQRTLEVARSIVHFGVLAPGIAEQHGALYHLLTGQERWSALRLVHDDRVLSLQARRNGVDIDHFPVRLFTGSPHHRLLLPLIENSCRTAMNEVDTAERLHQLLQAGADAEEVKGMLGAARFRDLLAVLELPPEVQQQLKRGTLSARVALRFARHLPKPGQLVRKLHGVARKVNALYLSEPPVRPVKEGPPRKRTPMRTINEAARLLHESGTTNERVQGALCVLHALQKGLHGAALVQALWAGQHIEAPPKKKRGRPKRQAA